MVDRVEVKGIDQLKAALANVPKAMRKRVLRNALAAGAREVRDEARRNAVFSSISSAPSPYRKPRTVRDAIRVRTSKADRREGNVGVFVNVRPARAGQRGAKNPNDPFYWRFLEFGTSKMRARPFLRPAANKLGKALQIFEAKVSAWVNKVNQTGNTNTP